MKRIRLTPDTVNDFKLRDFVTAPVDKQRFLVHSGNIQASSHIIKYETEEKLCYFQETSRPRFGAKGFLQRTADEGVTYDKKKKKLMLWYGKSLLKMSTFITSAILSDLNLPELNNLNSRLQVFLTRSSLEKIIKGKISTIDELMSHYVKIHLRVKDADPKIYTEISEMIHSHGFSINFSGIGDFNDFLRYAKEPNETMKALLEKNCPNFKGYESNNVRNNARILGTKIDWLADSNQFDYEEKRNEKAVEKLQSEWNQVKEFYEYLDPKNNEENSKVNSLDGVDTIILI